MIFQIDKTIYEQLSETERYIVDFISQNEDKERLKKRIWSTI